jgi:hypothetical protein
MRYRVFEVGFVLRRRRTKCGAVWRHVARRSAKFGVFCAGACAHPHGRPSKLNCQRAAAPAQQKATGSNLPMSEHNPNEPRPKVNRNHAH